MAETRERATFFWQSMDYILLVLSAEFDPTTGPTHWKDDAETAVAIEYLREVETETVLHALQYYVEVWSPSPEAEKASDGIRRIIRKAGCRCFLYRRV